MRRTGYVPLGSRRSSSIMVSNLTRSSRASVKVEGASSSGAKVRAKRNPDKQMPGMGNFWKLLWNFLGGRRNFLGVFGENRGLNEKV